MKIVLKHDWDVPIGPPNRIKKNITKNGDFHSTVGSASYSNAIKEYDGYYCGRKIELEKLTNELLRRSTGSILVSGYRGVGKTSLVYKALSNLIKKNNDILIVILNAAQLDVRSPNGDVDPKKIIENLIRRLYLIANETPLDIDIKNKIDLLYQKAAASVVNIKNSCLNQSEQANENTQESNLSITIKNERLILIVSGLLALLFQYINTSSELFNVVFPILIAFSGSFYFVHKSNKLTMKTKSIKESADEVYMFDNCISNLEFDLERIHTQLYYNYNKKVIYVVDELDKLEDDKVNLKKVEDILNYFKNFFSLSNAMFVFIGSEKLYDSILTPAMTTNPTNMLSRPKNYTYFTSKYFISRPHWLDLNLYFDEIIDHTDLTSAQLDVIKRALCFEARNDFFDLKMFISSRITSIDSSERPVIEFMDIEDDINKARFHKSITLLYEEKYKSNYAVDWRDNERLINKLYQHIHIIFENGSNNPIKDPDDDTFVSQLMRDFNGFMEFLGAFKVLQENPKKIRELNVQIRTYMYIGYIPTEPPSHLSEATEYEKQFLHKFDLFMDFAKAIISSFLTAKGADENNIATTINNPQNLIAESSNLGHNIQRIYEMNIDIYKTISKKDVLYIYRRVDIEKKTKDIESHTENMLNSLPEILSKMITLLHPKRSFSIIRNCVDDVTFNIIPAEFRQNFLRGLVIIDQESSRQILFTSKNASFLKKISSELKASATTHKVVYITKIQENDLENANTISLINPKKLKESAVSFLIDTTRFLSGYME